MCTSLYILYSYKLWNRFSSFKKTNCSDYMWFDREMDGTYLFIYLFIFYLLQFNGSK